LLYFLNGVSVDSFGRCVNHQIAGGILDFKTIAAALERAWSGGWIRVIKLIGLITQNETLAGKAFQTTKKFFWSR
jgi:hypothetical protein